VLPFPPPPPPRSKLFLAELCLAIVTTLFGLVSWTLLVLSPFVVPAFSLAVIGLRNPRTLASRPWLQWALHTSSLGNALVLLTVIATSCWR
jgi:hypothetical protein